MPGKVKVKIISGRNLPVMDRSSDTTDAYVEVKFGNTTYKTDVCRKSLNPRWNSEWYRFEVDDAELQDEPLQIRIMDYDMYSANDAIGKVYIDLNPLLLPVNERNLASTVQASPLLSGDVQYSTSGGKTSVPGAKTSGSGSVMSGWLPVYDTMHGIRGEVNVTVKIELFNDFNKFRQSSCGIKFFCSPNIPYGYYAQVIHGFVEELIVNDDPEYHWIDKIRTPRASNEARQTLFFKLSGEIQRKIGLKALDLGANAVLGYHQYFDLEGDCGIVARGIATAVTLVKNQELASSENISNELKDELKPSDENLGLTSLTPKDNVLQTGHYRTESMGSKSVKVNSISFIHRRSSDSDLSITPKGNSLSNTERPALLSSGGTAPTSLIRSTIKQPNWELLDFPFITMSKFPPGLILNLGGTVSARSVKLLERISNLEEPESRDGWWNEIRMEMRSHARALACNVILGYVEQTSICDDVCVLSACGTAAVISLNDLSVVLPPRCSSISNPQSNSGQNNPETPKPEIKEEKATFIPHDFDPVVPSCGLCHIPYCESSVPFPIIMLKCSVCKHSKVPDVLITTIEMPDECLSVGRGCLIQAHVCRPKRELRSELNAKEISDGLPFLEYDLHRLLINKLKIKGMNTIFGLKVQITIGDKMLVATASGTGVFLLPLPAPTLPKLVAGVLTTNQDKLNEMQGLLKETVKNNKENYQLKNITEVDDLFQYVLPSGDSELNDGVTRKLDLSTGNKDSCVLEIDDAEDTELFEMLMERNPPNGFHIVNMEHAPGLEEYETVKNLQMFIQISRLKFPTSRHSLKFDQHFQSLLQTVCFKLRRMAPCIICQVHFRVDIPEADEVQLTAFGLNRKVALVLEGTAMGISKSNKYMKCKRKIAHSLSKEGIKNDMDDIFTLEEDEEQENSPFSSKICKSPINGRQNFSFNDAEAYKHGIDVTSLSFIPGGKIVQYLGNLNFFFIRESTSIREENGISSFVHSFVNEVLAILRAHIAALGGNAMVSFFLHECVLFSNPHKNQAQCLVNVGGDVVFVSYFEDSLKVAQTNQFAHDKN